MTVAVYDPQNVVMAYGSLIITGYADGQMIEIAMQGDGVSASVGTQGEAVLIENHNFSAEITARLMATGLGQVVLSALHASKKARNVARPLTITSINTGETIASGLAKIKNFPDAAFGDDAPVREIVFVVARLEFTASPIPVPI